jgi:acylphosphatase
LVPPRKFLLCTRTSRRYFEKKMIGKPGNSMTERRTYHFDGRVQGVGFRYTTHNIAQQYAVHGYVRNLPDGRVELVVEGDESEVESLLNNLQRRMMGFIRHTEAHTGPATGEFENFNIRH